MLIKECTAINLYMFNFPYETIMASKKFTTGRGQ